MTPGCDFPHADRPAASSVGRPTPYDVATRMLAFRHARAAAFAPFDLTVSDVAWELLLSLFVAQERGARLGLRALCDTLDQPGTVSLRWLRALLSHGLIDYDDRADGWSAQVRLTPAADNALRGLIGG